MCMVMGWGGGLWIWWRRGTVIINKTKRMGVLNITGPVLQLTPEPSPTALSSPFLISSLICSTLKCAWRWCEREFKNWQLLFVIWVTERGTRPCYLKQSLKLCLGEIHYRPDVNVSKQLAWPLQTSKLWFEKVAKEDRGILSCLSFFFFFFWNSNDFIETTGR